MGKGLFTPLLLMQLGVEGDALLLRRRPHDGDAPKLEGLPKLRVADLGGRHGPFLARPEGDRAGSETEIERTLAHVLDDHPATFGHGAVGLWGDGTVKIFPRPSPVSTMPPSSSGIRSGLRTLGAGLAGLVYPALCLGCERRLSEPTLALCPTCLRSLPRADAALVAAALTDSTIEHAVALWTFDPGGTVRRVQHALKYGGRPSLGVPLGRLVGRAFLEAGVLPDVVAPIPLSHVRRLERGYNQAAGLAEGVAEELGARVEIDLLVRTRATQKQSKLSRARRRENVAGAFALRNGANVAGLRVLLVDDVLTTGATVDAAARVLAEVGATVDVAVLALAGA